MALLIAEELNLPMDLIVPHTPRSSSALFLLPLPTSSLLASSPSFTSSLPLLSPTPPLPPHRHAQGQEFAFGPAISTGDVYWNRDFLQHGSSHYGFASPPSSPDMLRAAEADREECGRRRYRGDLPPLQVAGKTAIVVDDGVASGATMKAAVQALRGMGVARVVVAVPVGSPLVVRDLQAVCEEVLCPVQPVQFRAVSAAYEHFEQVEDADVVDCMRREARRRRQWETREGVGKQKEGGGEEGGKGKEGLPIEALKEAPEYVSGLHV